jgi:hypothetical protein
MDDDYDPTKIVFKKKRKKKKSKFLEAVTTSKPTFDPSEILFSSCLCSNISNKALGSGMK